MSKTRADWLDRPFVRKIVESLGADNVRFVGGAVRDWLVGRAVRDIDAATTHTPEMVKERLEESGIKAVPTGIEHGTITAVFDGKTVEITTLRKDMETDGRRATVAFTDNWKADAARRDFTFNALYLSPDGTLHDPFDGQEDLKAGRVRFIGNAETRIEEDALRIMRFFRFHAWYGKGEPDESGVAACTQKVVMLRALSAERVRSELLKLLSAPGPLKALTAFERTGATAVLQLSPLNSLRLERYITHEHAHDFDIDALMRLACWLMLDTAEVAPFAKRFRLSKMEKVRLQAVVGGFEVPGPVSPAGLRALIYHHGRESAQCRVLSAKDSAASDIIDILKNWRVPSFPLKGGDLIEHGMQAGPEVSRRMSVLEDLWVESDFTLSGQELLAKL
ncbi:CCA tRNA nucleotidyltransferase [Kordiimonas aestuarii]|uniref:CCA tRNA nucleotidyltransferase n=1 Tax=Kordiimonas aestuarii TaxID=1005925 RepID=UPI0021CFD1D1|nr:CCA tRNA nucleotidyltransferase [Kordiimonas aestuarii]